MLLLKKKKKKCVRGSGRREWDGMPGRQKMIVEFYLLNFQQDVIPRAGNLDHRLS